MPIQFRNYTSVAGITDDYHKAREFFVRLGNAEFDYARWDWMTTHTSLDKAAVGRIGIWEDNGQIVGVATFDTQLGYAYCLSFPEYAYLKRNMLLYARENLSGQNKFGVLIPDSDHDFQDVAAELGFIATEDKENDAIFYIQKTSVHYDLPIGYRIASMDEAYDAFEYRRILWKGFNHELNGEGKLVFSEKEKIEADNEMYRPNVDLNLKIAVVAPNGHYASYCGMWYEPKAGYAVIEPVATDPDYRRMGLGKAAVLEGIKRVGTLGAKTAIVGSSQQFYYSIGLRPYATATTWISK